MKPIKYTEDYIEREAQKAYDAMKNKLQLDAVACHSRDKGTEAEVRPQIHFSTKAWNRARALVNMCDKEIAWHGFVQRQGLMFMITDVVVPPQVVTGTSVESDSSKWAEWSAHLTDEQFNSMRCHMHSHVNMGVFSSGVDDDYQKDMVTKNGNLDYYIFLIFNKRGDIFARVYDVENNIMYDDSDVDIVRQNDKANDWAAKQIEKMVETKKFNYAGQFRNTTKSSGVNNKAVNDVSDYDDYDDEDDGFNYYMDQKMKEMLGLR